MITRHAAAKLNLTLAVVGRREDGFHDLHSVFVPLEFGDDVSVEAAGGATDRLEIEGADELPNEPENLVLQAIAAARDAVGTGCPPLAVLLKKRIPVGAGLGGGSSDAAATLGVALEQWRAQLPAARLAALAASLGSDVPFFLASRAALVTGRGEHVDPLPPLRGEAPAVLLVTPRIHVSTPAVFAAYAAGARPAASALAISRRLADSWRAGLPATALLDLAADLGSANDLLPATLAVEPRLGAWRAALQDLLGRPAAQSGSGPTAWVLYPSVAAAEEAAVRVRGAAGRLPPLGDGDPFVLATRFTGG